MSATFQGTYFDAENLQPHPVAVEAAAGRLWFKVGEVETEVTLDVVRISDRLANIPRQLYLPGHRTIETSDHAAIDALLVAHDRGRLAAIIHWLETRARFAAAATVMLVAAVLSIGYFGLPLMARRAALAVPDSIDRQAGNAALGALNRMLGPSQLQVKHHLKVQGLLDVLVQKGGLKQAPRLELRSMGGQFPNAFALPGGILVVSDELVQLASDEELQAVLAHELGHIEHRHSLQSVLRGSAALLVVSTITGDLSTLTTFSSTIPFLLLQKGFSREFEEEADAYAVNLLRAAKIDRIHFAAVLQKLADARPKVGQDFTYLSTHPSMADRIKKIDPTGRAAVLAARVEEALSPARAGSVRRIQPTTAITENALLVSKLDVPPQAISQTVPAYPAQLRAADVEGNVTVGFVVDEDGNVREPLAIRSADPGFEAPALAAIVLWKFTPGKLEGRSVATRMQVEIEFKLDESHVGVK